MRKYVLLLGVLYFSCDPTWSQQKVTLDHPNVSPAGFKATNIEVVGTEAPWLAETDACNNTDKFNKADKRETSWLLTIEAERLVIGVNRLFVCREIEQGRQPGAQPIEITRDDTIPQVVFDPPAGEYGSMPVIALKAVNAERIIYTLGESAPVFDAFGKPTSGNAYSQAIKTAASRMRINARAISAAGVVSPVASAEYRENRRLKGWNGLDIYTGALYVSTISSVKKFLPSGVGGLVGLRYGLDDIWSPNQNDINARPFYLPGAWAELQYLRFEHTPYTENAIALVAGPEWQLPINRHRTLLITFGAGVGAALLAVKTPTYGASATTTAVSAKMGVEWQLGALALAAQLRYAYFADQASPLGGVGFSMFLVFRI